MRAGQEEMVRSINTEPIFSISTYPLAGWSLNSQVFTYFPNEVISITQSDSIFPYSKAVNVFYYADQEELVKVHEANEQWRIMLGPIRFIYAIWEKVVVIGEQALWEVEEGTITQSKSLDVEVSYGFCNVLPFEKYNIILATFNKLILFYTRDYELIWAIKMETVVLKMSMIEQPSIRGLLTILTEEG